MWAALALSGEAKMGIHDPRDMEIAAKAAESIAHTRWLVSDDVDEHLEQIAPTSATGSTTSCSTSRAPTRRRPSPATASWSCRGCGSGSGLTDVPGDGVADARRSCSTQEGRPRAAVVLDADAARHRAVAPRRRGGARPRGHDRGVARRPARVPRGRAPGRTPTTTCTSRGKRRVVEHFGHSSFHERQRHEAAGDDLRGRRRRCASRVRAARRRRSRSIVARDGPVGVVLVSGLPQDDHALIVEALEAHLARGRAQRDPPWPRRPAGSAAPAPPAARRLRAGAERRPAVDQRDARDDQRRARDPVERDRVVEHDAPSSDADDRQQVGDHRGPGRAPELQDVK